MMKQLLLSTTLVIATAPVMAQSGPTIDELRAQLKTLQYQLDAVDDEYTALTNMIVSAAETNLPKKRYEYGIEHTVNVSTGTTETAIHLGYTKEQQLNNGVLVSYGIDALYIAETGLTDGRVAVSATLVKPHYEATGLVQYTGTSGVGAGVEVTVDLVENRQRGLSVIAGAHANEQGVDAYVGVEYVGPHTGVAVTPIDIKVVERIGPNGEFRARYSINPLIVIATEITGGRSALDVLEDNEKRIEANRELVGHRVSLDDIKKVPYEDLEPKFWHARTHGRTLYADKRWSNEPPVEEKE